MKIIGRILIGIVVLIVVFLVFKNPIIKAGISFGAEKALGLELGMKKLDINLSGTFIEIGDFHLNNVEGFEERTMMQIPEVYVDYELQPLLKGNIHLTDLRLHLSEFIITRNAKGQLNINALKEKFAADEKKEQAKKPEEKTGEAKKQGGLQVDHMHLKIDKVIYKDYSVSAEDPLVQTFDVKIDEEHENITKPEAIIGIVVGKALKNSALARLTNMNPQEFLQSNIFDTLTMTNQMATGIGNKATSTVEGVVGGTTEKAGDAANEAMGALKDAVKMPFGKKDESPA